jgi:flagellar biosynthetic protein FliQ
MTQEQVLSIFKAALFLVLKIGGPLLVVSIVLGLVISIFQAATQIHEQTLTFVPKLVAIAVLLLLMGPWIMNSMNDFTRDLFDIISNIT